MERAIGDPDDEDDPDPLMVVLVSAEGTHVEAQSDDARGRIYQIRCDELAPLWRAFVAADFVPALQNLMDVAQRAADADADVRPTLPGWRGGLDFLVHWTRAVLLLQPNGDALVERYDPARECSRPGKAGTLL